VLIGGAVAHVGNLSLAAVIAAAVAGAMIGDNIGFVLGRRYGERLTRRLPSWLISRERGPGDLDGASTRRQGHFAHAPRAWYREPSV
jgi:undecaprenyl-diphosphatase